MKILNKLGIVTRSGKVNLKTIVCALGIIALVYFFLFSKTGVGDWKDMLRFVCSNNS